MAWVGKARQARQGAARQGTARRGRQGQAWPGSARRGQAGQNTVIWHIYKLPPF